MSERDSDNPQHPGAGIDFATERREYEHGALQREHLRENPIDQFSEWLLQAKDAGVSDATAMTLATVDDSGWPSQRMVLLKGLSEEGFVFFTNLGSRKAAQIAHNPVVSLHFAWLALDRQVIVRGRAQRLSLAEDARYFLSRPRESQLAAWASRQSHPITARRLLTEKFLEIKQRFADHEVPVPRFWGGFRVVPEAIEFWQGRENRLHDRFEYRQHQGDWRIERLSP